VTRRPAAAALLCGLLAVPLWAADDPPAAKPKAAAKNTNKRYDIPYRLTDTKHVMVRVKVNGKGPFNMILDTGAPAIFLAKVAAKKAGLEADEKGWAKTESFELEGGLKVPNTKVRVEDPFQLQGMNRMGLMGMELHGMIGYTLLAKYRVEYDFTADKLGFEPLDFTPPAFEPLDKGKIDSTELDAMVGLTKMMTAFFGKPNYDTVPRGFVGLEFEEKGGAVVVKKVYPGSPADKAGIKPGDAIESVKNVTVDDARDLARALAKAGVGQKLKVKVKRGDSTEELTVELGRGL
jgi:hypothetical protein